MDDRLKKPLDEVFAEIIWSVLSGVHTISLGQIQSFDPDNQLADIQIVNKRRMVDDDEARPLATLKKVFVMFPGDGDFFLTFKPKVGSYCILFVNERSLDNWYELGGIVDPDSPRKFDLSDCVALCGLNPKALKLGSINDGIALRNRTLGTFVQVLETEINLKNPLGSATLGSDGSFDVNGNLKVLV